MEATEKRLIAVKAHNTPQGLVVGACDIELLGKSFSEGELRLELEEEFYLEKEIPADELIEFLGCCITANLAGERAVKAYCDNFPEHSDSVIHISGVPHLQVFML
jgi:uncharacterized protein